MKNGLLVILALAVIGLAAVAWFNQSNLKELRDKEQDARKQAQQAKQETGVTIRAGEMHDVLQAEQERALRQSRYRNQVQRAQLLMASDPGAALEILRDKNACPEDLRDFIWHLTERLTNRERWSVPTGSVAAFSYDGSTLAIGSNESKKITVYQVYTPTQVAVLEGMAKRLAVSATGTLVASDDGHGEIKLWDVKRRSAVLLKADRNTRLIGFAGDGLALVGCTAEEVVSWKLPYGDPGAHYAYRCSENVVLTGDQAILSLVSGSDKAVIARLDLATGKTTEMPVITPEGLDPARVSGALLSGDGSRLAVATDTRIFVWEAATGSDRLKIDWPGAKEVQLTFTADNQGLTTWRQRDGRMQVWSLFDRPPLRLRLMEPGGKRGVLATSRDGQTLVMGSARGASVLDLEVNPSRLEHGAERAPGTPAALAPDGSTLAICEGGNLRIEDLKDVEPPKIVPPPAAVKSLHFDPTSRFLAAQLESGIVFVVRIAKSEKIEQFEMPGTQFVFSPDGKTLTTISREGKAYKGDMATGQYMEVAKVEGKAILAPGGSLFVSLSADRKKVILRDLAQPRELVEINPGDSPIKEVRFTANGTALFTRSQDGQVTGRDLIHGSSLPIPGDLRLPVDPIPLWEVSPDGRFLAAAGQDGRVFLWNLVSGQRVGDIRSRVRPDRGDELTGLTFSPDGKLLTLYGADKIGPVGLLQFFDSLSGEESQHVSPAARPGGVGGLRKRGFRGGGSWQCDRVDDGAYRTRRERRAYIATRKGP